MDVQANSNRLTDALATLKMQLAGIREQDVDLMKQLLKIKSTINELCPKRSSRIVTAKRNLRKGKIIDELENTDLQTNYMAYNYQRRGSCASTDTSLSSIEELSDSEDLSSNSEINVEMENAIGSKLDTEHLFKNEHLKDHTSHFYNSDEVLLISNIKVWKYRQSQSLE